MPQTSELLWAMEPIACNRLFASVFGVAKHADNLSAGPADDAKDAGLPIQLAGSTAIIRLHGPMVRRVGFWGRYFGLTGTADVAAAVASAAADDLVENIVLDIDSPGGSVSGTPELAAAVRRASEQKNVIAQVSGSACSGAYWVASQASQIFAGPTDIVGSIGVILMLYDYSKMFEEAGIEAVPIDTGPYKSAGATGTVITKEHRADFQHLVDGLFSEFLAAITAGRGLSGAALDQVTDGRCFLGKEAVGLGLIDGLQTMETTLAGLTRPARQGRSTAAAKARLALMNLEIV